MPRGIPEATAPLRRLLRQFGWRAGRRTGAAAWHDASGCRGHPLPGRALGCTGCTGL